MIALPHNRAKVLRWAAAALAVWALAWYARHYRPATASAATREHAVAAREAKVREARAAAVLHGPAGLDSLLERFRADSLLLATRIPPAAEAAALSAQVKDALGVIERRAGVRITATEPLPAGTEGRFQTGGYAVRVVGRYEDVGYLLAELASLQRLTRTRGFRLHAIPDSLLRGARPYGTPGAGGALAPADSAGVAAALADAGETPFKASAMFDLLWYTLPPGDTGAASPDTLAAGSSFAPGGAP
ncbi:MAG TPA: GspMb/PilO family protein [Longimicrobium sp.]